MNLYVGMDAELLIGARTGMSGTRIVAMNHIEIGEDCMIGAGCLICDSDMHEIPLLSGNPVRFKPIHIGDKVFIGANSILLKGVSIGEQSIIGAGAVVTKPIPEGMIAIGNPASVIQPSLRNPITS
jgi:acetyltransferase-like isoleucine patch superfamily enzyme